MCGRYSLGVVGMPSIPHRVCADWYSAWPSSGNASSSKACKSTTPREMMKYAKHTTLRLDTTVWSIAPILERETMELQEKPKKTKLQTKLRKKFGSKKTNIILNILVLKMRVRPNISFKA